eukprot:1071872-Rhodomonas_salina.1
MRSNSLLLPAHALNTSGRERDRRVNRWRGRHQKGRSTELVPPLSRMHAVPGSVHDLRHRPLKTEQTCTEPAAGSTKKGRIRGIAENWRLGEKDLPLGIAFEDIVRRREFPSDLRLKIAGEEGVDNLVNNNVLLQGAQFDY